MSEPLVEALHRSAEALEPPVFEPDVLVAEAGRRQRRRRVLLTGAAILGVLAIVLGSLAFTRQRPHSLGPSHDGPQQHHDVPSPGARPLVYAVGRTIHIGDRVVTADTEVGFIAPTDDGAVYEGTLDTHLWFTDGETTELIGRSDYTAAPTAHAGIVDTSDRGSLVAWGDVAGQPDRTPAYVFVYDTSSRQVVARIPVPEPGVFTYVVHVEHDQVWYAPDVALARRVYRYNVSTGRTATLAQDGLNADLAGSPRTFAADTEAGLRVYGTPTFTIRGHELVGQIEDGASAEPGLDPVLDGEPLRLRLPDGYTPPWPADSTGSITLSQWLDDSHVALFADDGGGDLPAKEGDVLVCPVPTGTCRVTVPRTSEPVVAP